VPLPAHRHKSRPEILRSPVWSAVLAQVRYELDQLTLAAIELATLLIRAAGNSMAHAVGAHQE
jgi:hypothetical protein